MPSRRATRVLEFFLLQWVVNTGRLVVLALSFGKVRLPKTDLASYEAQLERCPGTAGRIWLTIKLFAADEIGLVVGAITWVIFALLAVLVIASLVGPIPPIHTWRA